MLDLLMWTVVGHNDTSYFLLNVQLEMFYLIQKFSIGVPECDDNSIVKSIMYVPSEAVNKVNNLFVLPHI